VGSSAARLSDDTLELINLSLGTAEGTEPLLRELAGTLVLGVAEQLNDTALVGSKTGNLLDNVADEGGALAHLALGAGDARLDDASGGFLYFQKKSSSQSQRPSSAFVLRAQKWVCIFAGQAKKQRSSTR